MSVVENLTDEEIEQALAALETKPDQTMDPLEAHQAASRYMKRIRSLMAGKAVVDASYKAQIGEIDAWYRQESERFDAEVSRLKMELEPYVSMLVASEPMGRKSVNLVAGRAGFREGRERVVVDDEDAAVAYFESVAGEKFVRVKKCVDIPAIKRAYHNPEAIPGIRVEKGDRQFYVDPVFTEDGP